MHSSLARKCEEKFNLYGDGKSHSRVDNKDYQELHIPVMVKEVVNFLAPQQGQVSWNFLWDYVFVVVQS